MTEQQLDDSFEEVESGQTVVQPYQFEPTVADIEMADRRHGNESEVVVGADVESKT